MMTAAVEPWYVRPRVVFPLLAAMIVAATLFTPTKVQDGDRRLSSTATGAMGAAIFYRLADRLGWEVARTTAPDIARDPRVVHVLLAPVTPMRTSEVREILASVRAGGGLLLSLGGATEALADSLGVGAGRSPSYVDWSSGDRLCQDAAQERSVSFAQVRQLLPVEWRRVTTEQRTTFYTVTRASRRRNDRRPEGALVGTTFGRGRVVVAADPDFFRNDQLRNCELGFSFALVESLEWLRDGGTVPRDRLVFDEYRQGYGRQSGTVAAVRGYLLHAPSGRVLLQFGIAGLVLLVAAAPRLVHPRDPERLERRSPLEHVDALSRAYEQVGATRTATGRLVRGLRRRTERRVSRGSGALTDEQYLARLADNVPSTAAHAALLRRALASDLSRDEFAAVGRAVRGIEQELAAAARR